VTKLVCKAGTLFCPPWCV